MSVLKSPYFLALDVDSPKKALELFEDLKDYIGGVKIGPRLALKDPTIISQIAKELPVFLDTKFYDIPSTVTSCVQAAFDLGASYVTVHAQNSPQALRDIAHLESSLNKKRFFRVLCVTVLTSFSGDKDTPPNWKNESTESMVSGLAAYCLNQGLSGIVCSAYEVANIKKVNPQSFIVTPGIRVSEDDHLDQARVMSPKEGLDQGADALVIGRSILNASNPKEVAQELYEILR